MKLSIIEESVVFLVRDEDSNMWLARDYWTLDKKSAKRHETRELAKESVKRYEALEREMVKETREKHRGILEMYHGGK